MSPRTHPAHLPGRIAARGSLGKAAMKNTSAPMYQHVRAELVSPRIMTLAADWQVWDSAKEGTEGTIHIDYDCDYG